MSNNTSSPIRCAVIGYGGAFNMGRQHLQQMEAAGMKAVAACDLDPVRMEQASSDFPGIRTYTDPEALIADSELDLCAVILPHNLHADYAIRLANAGKHAIVEKPMCISVAEADAMIDAARAAKVMLSIFHNRRWDADFNTIRDLIRKGTIGDVFHIEACMGGFSEPGTWWRSDKALSGGAMFDWGAHIIDWILHLVPQQVAGVDGYFHKRRWLSRTNEDHTELIIRFEGGETAQVEISSLAAASKPRWRILGTKGAIVMSDWQTVNVTVEHEGHLAKFDVKAKESVWQGYYDNIAGHLMRGEDLTVKPEEGRRIISIIKAAEESSNVKRTVVPAYV